MWLPQELGADRSPNNYFGLGEPLKNCTVKDGKGEIKHLALAAACLILWSECALEGNFNYGDPSEKTFILKQGGGEGVHLLYKSTSFLHLT